MDRISKIILLVLLLGCNAVFSQPGVAPTLRHSVTGPELQVDTLPIDFGSIAIGLDAMRFLALKNIGDEKARVNIEIDGQDKNRFSLGEGDREFELEANGAMREIVISFMPIANALGKNTASLNITTDPVTRTISIDLMGTAYELPQMEICDTPLRYTNALAAKETSSFKVKNVGGGKLGVKITEIPDWVEVEPIDAAIEAGNYVDIEVKIRRAGLCKRPPFQNQDQLTLIARDVTVTPHRFIGTTNVELKVEVNNPSPQVNAKFDGAIISLNKNKQTIFLALDSIFTDLNFDSSANQNLDYEAHAEIEGIVELAVIEDKLKISSQNDGFTEVTLSANDNGCNTAVIKFFVRVIRRPSIVHSPPDGQISDESLSVSVAITNDDQNTEVFLSYRQGGGNDWTGQKMFKRGLGDYEYQIGKMDVTAKGVEYYIVASNDQGPSSDPENGFHSIRVFVQNGIAKGSAQPSGNTQTGYRLISFPLDIFEKSPKQVLEDDLGNYDKSQWRFFELLEDYAKLSSSEKIYREFNEIARIVPGKAYLLLVKQRDKKLDTGAGTTFFTNRIYSIHLHPGFNLVSSPFNYPIPFANLTLKSGSKLEAWLYSGREAIPINLDDEMVQPFEGYFIANSEGANDSLRINPILFPRPTLAKQQLATASNPNEEWAVQVSANCQNARDTYNKAAVMPEANQEHDALDSPEVLTIGEYVSVYFPHPEWQRVFKNYSVDARPNPLAGDTWNFEVVSNIHDRVDLTFEGIAAVPGEFEVWLVDEELQITRDLRRDNHHSIVGPGPANPKRLKLVVGKKEYVGEITKPLQATLTTFELSQNFPNPFNPASTIRYGLPHAERVTLRVYNMLGEVAATLIENELKTPGYHTAIWNGRNAGGGRAGSGVYVYKLQAGSFTQSRKMLLVQ